MDQIVSLLWLVVVGTVHAVVYGVIAAGVTLGAILLFKSARYAFSRDGVYDKPSINKRALRWSSALGLITSAWVLFMFALPFVGGWWIDDVIEEVPTSNSDPIAPPQAPPSPPDGEFQGVGLHHPMLTVAVSSQRDP